ncbi:Gfo/Idh/MocA family protein [Paenibacillus lutrae]|uniref:Gfo/Idh/MocA family oxidoreductase n=1 Tax=Paenibacillus lutrae TaxID=2078573 RepID=A0A7X3K069_9BACL|nr:Gfo/Idh/MocA family oxidoreductase [Paenibacillus lutrae]MVP00833.1 gfo/Idh/MocA family oxidoreductase [Paenibacillus lutrae]
MLKVALLSFWHVHAADYEKDAIRHPGTELAAIWDEDAQRGSMEAQKRGLPFYEKLDDLLADPAIGGVIVTTPTNLHREVLIAAARAGKHIFTEKVIASTWAACSEILQAVAEAGIVLTVSLPRLNQPYTLAVQNILEQNLLGRLTLVRARLSHSGGLSREEGGGWLPERFFDREACQGGAMIDLGCHPMYLTRLFLGMPESVTASYGSVTGRGVEDNAVSVLRYPDGALGIVEAGFVNSYSPFVIEIHGTEGSLLYSQHDDRLLLRTRKQEGGGEGWTVIHDLPQPNLSAFEQWVDHIRSGTRAEANVQLAADLTKLMEASNRSAAEGCAVQIERD